MIKEGVTNLKTIYDYTYAQLEEYAVQKGWKKYRAKQLFEWLYRKRIDDFSLMSDVSKEAIAILQAEFTIDPLKVISKQVSKDGTTKYLFELQDGSAIETVLMHFDYGKSVCVTSQVGCNMGCTFCASGLLKKQRDLTAGEMVAQIMYIQKELDPQEERVSNIVVMGTGEPFDNYDSVMNFCSIVNHDRGLAIGARHITISTSGLIEGIRKFALAHVQYNLAISLHAPNDELRSKLMPINKAYPLNQLMDAIRDYSVNNNRRITFEYILLKELNDTVECADQLSKLLHGMNAYVNLIPYNEVDENGYKTTDSLRAMKFYDALKKRGIAVTLRTKHGEDIDAACGQLRAKHEGRL